MLPRMRVLAALALLMLLCGCVSQADDEDPVQVESIARACEPLAGPVARREVRATDEFSRSRVSYATQVRSLDVENFNIVAVEFAFKGSAHQTGVWAIGVGAEKGVGFALNEVAHRASSWPTSSSKPSHARLFTARTIYDVERCS